MCCAQEYDSLDECDQGGYSSREVRSKDMGYFLCPMLRSCGPRLILARPNAKVYTIDTKALDSTENYCMHQITFPMDAGRNDIIQVKFTEHVPGTRIFFAAATQLTEAKGTWIPESEL